jgi:flagellar basal-body rod modification protein FlgD
MAAVAGLFNQPTTQAATGMRALPMADGSRSTNNTPNSSSSSTSSATVSANDFLTLLVTELQNQDPTTASDPNEYVNQLVAVNSLEQLISINQTLTDAIGSSTTSTSRSSKTTPTATIQTHDTQTSSTTGPMAGVSVLRSSAGNLGIPQTNGAAERVAHALDGQSRPRSTTGTVSAVR